MKRSREGGYGRRLSTGIAILSFCLYLCEGVCVGLVSTRKREWDNQPPSLPAPVTRSSQARPPYLFFLTPSSYKPPPARRKRLCPAPTAAACVEGGCVCGKGGRG